MKARILERILFFFKDCRSSDCVQLRDYEEIFEELEAISGRGFSHISVHVKSVSKVLGKIPKPAAPTLQEDLSRDL